MKTLFSHRARGAMRQRCGRRALCHH
jgi:hypothetical protein